MFKNFFKQRIKNIDDAFTAIGDFIVLPTELVKNKKELSKRKKAVKKSQVPYKIDK
jgi:uncharacterized protein YeeX (DUF496 family)